MIYNEKPPQDNQAKTFFFFGKLVFVNLYCPSALIPSTTMFKLMQTKEYVFSLSSFLKRGRSRYSFVSGRRLHKVHSGNLHCSQARGPLDPLQSQLDQHPV